MSSDKKIKNEDDLNEKTSESKKIINQTNTDDDAEN